MQTKNKPYLRLVAGRDLKQRRLCKAANLIAASPRGDLLRPFLRSQTPDSVMPINSPILRSASPDVLRSSIMDCQLLMASILRKRVDKDQGQFATDLRKHSAMPRPADLPKLTTIGARVRWWREKRGITRPSLAKTIGMSYSGLADLENEKTTGSAKLHLIAAHLQLNAHYLETDKGEPEAGFAQEAPIEDVPWPFATIEKSVIARLTKVERGYLEAKLREAMVEISESRRDIPKAG